MSALKNHLALAAVALLLAAGCAQQEEAAPAAAPEAAPAPAAPAPAAERKAEAQLLGADGSEKGVITFVQRGDGPVSFVAEVRGVAPGTHGLHLHETGDCSAPDFTSAGGHFNPTDAPHGAPTDAERHAGDFGNIEVAADGVGRRDLATDMLTLAEDLPNSAVGRAVILHEKADDLVSQPTGAAGGRIACGVVQATTGPMGEAIPG